MIHTTIRLGLAVLVIVQAFGVAGCSGYTTAALPDDPEREPVAESGILVLEAGMHARIYLTNGEQQTGEVIAVSPDEVTIGRPGNHGFEETVIPAARIARVEVEASSTAESALAGAAGIAMLVVFDSIVAAALYVWIASPDWDNS